VSAEDVGIIGAGIHPFGRHPGVTGLQMAVAAARAALADAGVSWPEIDFAAGGSDAAGNADTSVSMLGLTGVPFVNVRNGCATGGSALTMAHAMLRAGSADLALVVGFDKHPPGAFKPRPVDWGLGGWYGETGLMLTTQFFAMKIQRYMSEYGISSATLAEVAAKAFRNGALNPDAWRRTPLTAAEILASKMVNHPLTQFMFCSPGKARRRWCWPGARGCAALPARRCCCGRLRCAPARSAHLKFSARRSRSSRPPRLRPWPPRPRSKRPASARPTWTSPRSRTPNPGPR